MAARLVKLVLMAVAVVVQAAGGVLETVAVVEKMVVVVEAARGRLERVAVVEKMVLVLVLTLIPEVVGGWG